MTMMVPNRQIIMKVGGRGVPAHSSCLAAAALYAYVHARESFQQPPAPSVLLRIRLKSCWAVHAARPDLFLYDVGVFRWVWRLLGTEGMWLNMYSTPWHYVLQVC